MEQPKDFISLARIIGKELAIFCCCGYLDIPYDPKIQADSWDSYYEQIKEKNPNKTFSDGITNIDVPLTKVLTNEERWLKVWGEGDEKKPYTENDYKRLDKLFETYTTRLVEQGGYDTQQEDTLRFCCKLRLEADKAVAKGSKENIDMAQKLDKMIRDNLSDENLRKKDSKPVAEAKLDGIVKAIQRKYGVGVEMTFEQAQEIAGKWLASHKYPMTIDAADHMILAILNTMRSNEDMPQATELDTRQRFNKKSWEFEESANDIEEEAYNYLGIHDRNNI